MSAEHGGNTITLGDTPKSKRIEFTDISPDGRSGAGILVSPRIKGYPIWDRGISFAFSVNPNGDITVETGSIARNYNATISQTDSEVTIRRDEPMQTARALTGRKHTTTIQINPEAITTNTTQLPQETAVLLAAGLISVGRRLFPTLRVKPALRRAGLIRR